MHELVVCQALIEAVEQIAAAEHAARVDDVYVSIGPLSGIEPPLLNNAFPIAAAGTIAAAAKLHIDNQAIRVRCSSCGAESAAQANRLLCAECNDWRTELVSGDGMLLERVCMTNSTEGVPANV